MAKSIYFQLYTNATTRDEAAEVAAVVDLYNLTELMCVKQMVGVEFSTSRSTSYSILVKVRGDADTTEFNQVVKRIDGVDSVGRYRNARQVKSFLLGYYTFFRI